MAKNPSAFDLAMRDQAAAALMGALPADFGGEFGGDDDGSWGWEDNVHGGFGADAAMPGPTPQQAIAAWHSMKAQRAEGAQREKLLYPNRNSTVKIEGYQFGLSQDVTLGTTVALSMSDSPNVSIRPRRVTMNAPAPGFATFSQLLVANVNTCVGGTLDAFGFNANGTGQGVSYPTVEPQNKISFSGTYTGLVPPGYANGATFKFVVDIKGPSSIAGGGPGQ